ncbi:MAG: 3-oxoacyl-(acyl-carrier-protein) reductase protein [Herminiimonas sp.]|nr:3-oxoacyl-(acyl-carrier-protein) reductase protein [Herminiimonas sp.]
MGNNAPINPVKELGEHRIAVNTVAPGAITTDLSRGMVRDNPEINQRVVAMTVLGRACMPDDIGPMIASLLSDDNRWINAPRSRVAWRSNAEGVPPTSLGGTLIYHRHQIASRNTYLGAS